MKLIKGQNLLLIFQRKMIKKEVYYWPLWFSQILTPGDRQKIKKLLPKLQQAQIYLWQALNIYDDFLDDEAKKENLPIANKYFRRYLEIHYRAGLSNDYYKLFDRIFNNLDNANRKEVLALHLKVKNGKVIIPKRMNLKNKINKNNPEDATHGVISLSKKSLTLALGPLALLSYLGDKSSSPRMKAGLNFFQHALAAKQLSDDSHDWLEDLKKGYISLANAPVLDASQKQKIQIDLKNSSEMAYCLFAEKSAPQLISQIKHQCQQARQEISRISSIENNIILNKIIRPLETACQKAESFRELLVK